MATPIVSPVIPTYSAATPYLTIPEYLASPTGVDTSQLVVRGTTQQNTDALSQTIARASSSVDRFVRKVLAATVDTQAGEYRQLPGGYLWIKLDNTPILQVNDVSVGNSPAALTSLSDLSQVRIGKSSIKVPLFNFNPSPVPYGYSFDRWYAVTTYVNGYANTLLAASIAAGGKTMTLISTLGIAVGQQLTMYDPGFTEAVVVQSVVGNVVTIVGTFQFAHTVVAGSATQAVSVSALPAVVKEATVLYTTALIKTRTAGSFVIPQIGGQPAQTAKTSTGGSREQELAEDLLADLRRAA